MRSPKRLTMILAKKNRWWCPIGNAGNITAAIMQGFLRLHDLNIIESAPGPSGSSPHADPVFPLLPEVR